MGMNGSWFRRRPSDDEMREELEAHLAMRAEHDGVDEAAARRRLGNLLQTRESMRRVWIAAVVGRAATGRALHLALMAASTRLRVRRHPRAGLGLGASTALFAALDRALFRPLPYADPDRLVSVGTLTPFPGRVRLRPRRCRTALRAALGSGRRRRSHR